MEYINKTELIKKIEKAQSNTYSETEYLTYYNVLDIIDNLSIIEITTKI